MKELEDEKMMESPLRRGHSFQTIVLTGHLFDTKCFNIVLDILGERKINFRVIEWEIGNNANEVSSVTL